MMEQLIEDYIRGELADAFPDIKKDEIIINFPSTSFELSEVNKRNNDKYCLGLENLTAHIIITTKEKINRLDFIRRFKIDWVDIAGVGVMQRYIGSEQFNFYEVQKQKQVIFKIIFSYEVFE